MQSSLINEIIEVRRKQLRKRILTTSIIAALSIILTILIIYWIMKKNSPGFGGVALVAAGSGVSAVSLIVALSTTGKLLIGPAKGAKTPVQALKKFYSNALVNRGTIFSKVQADAMFFIHPNAVETIGGWKLFQTYWNSVNDQIYSQLIKACKNTPTGTSFQLLNFKTITDSSDCKRYVIKIAFQTKYDKKNLIGQYDTYTEGPWIYNAENEIIKEGGRWFLSSADWTGQIESK